MASNHSTWYGEPPTHCDICDAPITTTFVDGRIPVVGWAIMCLACHRSHGCGFGVGRGQEYMIIAHPETKPKPAPELRSASELLAGKKTTIN